MAIFYNRNLWIKNWHPVKKGGMFFYALYQKLCLKTLYDPRIISEGKSFLKQKIKRFFESPCISASDNWVKWGDLERIKKIRVDLVDKNEIISFCPCIIAAPGYVKWGGRYYRARSTRVKRLCHSWQSSNLQVELLMGIFPEQDPPRNTLSCFPV